MRLKHIRHLAYIHHNLAVVKTKISQYKYIFSRKKRKEPINPAGILESFKFKSMIRERKYVSFPHFLPYSDELIYVNHI